MRKPPIPAVNVAETGGSVRSTHTGSATDNADLAEDVKVKVQSYISGCYGSLTSFNVLFADEDDQFKGSGGD